MLLSRIKNDDSLKHFIRQNCEDNGICVSIDERISPDDIVIIKVDDYYNSLHLPQTPASVDCLILQKCSKDEYSLTVVELKTAKETRRIDVANTEEKFTTCFSNFMENRFKEYFVNDRHYRKIKLYYVSKMDLYGKSNVNNSLKLRLIKEIKVKFRQKTYLIEPRMPTPVVTPC